MFLHCLGSGYNHEYRREEQDALHPDRLQYRGADPAQPQAEPAGAGAGGRVGAGGSRLHHPSLTRLQSQADRRGTRRGITLPPPPGENYSRSSGAMSRFGGSVCLSNYPCVINLAKPVLFE